MYICDNVCIFYLQESSWFINNTSAFNTFLLNKWTNLKKIVDRYIIIVKVYICTFFFSQYVYTYIFQNMYAWTYISANVCMFVLRKTSVQPFTCYTVVFNDSCAYLFCILKPCIKICIWTLIYAHINIYNYIHMHM